RRALAYANEESMTLRHKAIDCGHLVLGLLRIENSAASVFLRQHGVDYASYREALANLEPPAYRLGAKTAIAQTDPSERAMEWEEHEEHAASPTLGASISNLKQRVAGAVEHFDTYSDEYGERQLKRKPWSRKQALGHLINLAAA